MVNHVEKAMSRAAIRSLFTAQLRIAVLLMIVALAWGNDSTLRQRRKVFEVQVLKSKSEENIDAGNDGTHQTRTSMIESNTEFRGRSHAVKEIMNIWSFERELQGQEMDMSMSMPGPEENSDPPTPSPMVSDMPTPLMVTSDLPTQIL